MTSPEDRSHTAGRPLLDQHDWAIENLLNAPVASDADVESVADRHREWRDRVIALMEEMSVGESDIRYFRSLGTFVFRRLDGFNEDHRQLKSVIAERCERLRKIARGMEDG